MDNIFEIHVPVLLIAFNRPGVLKQSFQYIRNAKPQKLYVAIDGPRVSIEDEVELVNQVSQIVQNIDWPCETYYKVNEENKGAEVNVSSAISWVFEREEYAIILEDDIIAPESFFKFAQEMLIKYKDEGQIGTVTGSNFTPIPVPGNTDYFLAKYGHSGGGWATWKRVWDEFDLNVEIPKEHLEIPFLRTITNTLAEAKYFQKGFKSIKQKGPGNSTWDSIGNYYHRINNRLSVIPKMNLTSNIGTYGLHANGKSEHHFRSYDEYFMVKIHPEKLFYFKEYDMHHFNSYINKKTPIYKWVQKKLKKFLAFTN